MTINMYIHNYVHIISGVKVTLLITQATNDLNVTMNMVSATYQNMTLCPLGGRHREKFSSQCV